MSESESESVRESMVLVFEITRRRKRRRRRRRRRRRKKRKFSPFSSHQHPLHPPHSLLLSPTPKKTKTLKTELSNNNTNTKPETYQHITRQKS